MYIFTSAVTRMTAANNFLEVVFIFSNAAYPIVVCKITQTYNSKISMLLSKRGIYKKK